MPRGNVGELHASTDANGNIIGEVSHKVRTGVNLHSLLINDELPELLRQMGISARHRLAPSNTDYRALVDSDGRPVQDESYTINHDEFVRLAGMYDCAVVSDETILTAGELQEATPSHVPADGESQKQRQARRYQACIDAGLTMPTDDYSHLPRGIGKLAKAEGITRQAFAEDVKAHIRQLNGR